MHEKITLLDIANDTVSIVNGSKPVLIVLINEPSCTGCKENTAEYFNSLKSKYTQYAFITSYPSIVSRKTYEKYLSHRFKNLSGIYYSLNNRNSNFLFGDSLITIDTQKSPQIFLIKGSTTKGFSYNEIFTETQIKQRVKEEIKAFGF